jgi:hypothetical protein
MACHWLLAATLILVAGVGTRAEVAAAAAAGPGYCSCLKGFKEPQCSRSLQVSHTTIRHASCHLANQHPSFTSLQALCQKEQQPFCGDLSRFANASDVAAGQRVASRLKDTCGWQVSAERTTPCDCLQVRPSGVAL